MLRTSFCTLEGPTDVLTAPLHLILTVTMRWAGVSDGRTEDQRTDGIIQYGAFTYVYVFRCNTYIDVVSSTFEVNLPCMCLTVYSQSLFNTIHIQSAIVFKCQGMWLSWKGDDYQLFLQLWKAVGFKKSSQVISKLHSDHLLRNFVWCLCLRSIKISRNFPQQVIRM